MEKILFSLAKYSKVFYFEIICHSQRIVPSLKQKLLIVEYILSILRSFFDSQNALEYNFDASEKAFSEKFHLYLSNQTGCIKTTLDIAVTGLRME